MKRLLLAVLFLYSTFAGASTILPPYQYVIYKNPGVAMVPQIAQQWLAPAQAYTADTIPAMLDIAKANGWTANYALARIVWTANSPSAYNGAAIFICPPQSSAGTGLVGCSVLTYFAANDSGPASYTPGCGPNPGGPMGCAADVTSVLNAAIATGATDQFLVGGAYGNGTQSPLIWAIEIFVNWIVP